MIREPYDHLSIIPILLKRPPSIDNSDFVVDIMCEDSNADPKYHDTLMRVSDYVLLSFSP